MKRAVYAAVIFVAGCAGSAKKTTTATATPAATSSVRAIALPGALTVKQKSTVAAS